VQGAVYQAVASPREAAPQRVALPADAAAHPEQAAASVEEAVVAARA
jgi:hypothetical protein